MFSTRFQTAKRSTQKNKLSAETRQAMSFSFAKQSIASQKRERPGDFLSAEVLTTIIERTAVYERQLDQNRAVLLQMLKRKEGELHGLQSGNLKLSEDYNELREASNDWRKMFLKRQHKALETMIAAEGTNQERQIEPEEVDEFSRRPVVQKMSVDTRSDDLNSDLAGLKIALMIAGKKLGENEAIDVLTKRVDQLEVLLKRLKETPTGSRPPEEENPLTQPLDV